MIVLVSSMKRFIFITACLFVFIAAAGAETFEIPRYGYFFNVPGQWSAMDSSDSDAVSFQRGGESVIFQALTMDGESFSDAEEIFGYISQVLALEGEPIGFEYNGSSAVFAEIEFNAAGSPVHGYCICINDTPEDLTLLAYAPDYRYAEVYTELLSCLDGFSAGSSAKLLPGPVSQYQYPWPGPHPEPLQVKILGSFSRVVLDPLEPEVSQELIEREAEILAALKELDVPSWYRYYTLIYRDSFSRFKPLYRPVYNALTGDKDGLPSDRRTAEVLLEWIQGFSYIRTGTVSDLLAPLACVLQNEGDCDARCLAYMIFLKLFGIDSILLVSSAYGHSLVGVDVPGPGARFEYGGKQYLIAETTDQVDIGLIDQTMADPAKWIPMQLHP